MSSNDTPKRNAEVNRKIGKIAVARQRHTSNIFYGTKGAKAIPPSSSFTERSGPKEKPNVEHDPGKENRRDTIDLSAHGYQRWYRREASAVSARPPPSFPRDWSRGPPKKWSSPPFPSTPGITGVRSSSSYSYAPAAPVLHQTSSSYSVYHHHRYVHPQFCLTASRGQQLMTQPLLSTPGPGPVLTPSSSLSTISTTWPVSRAAHFQTPSRMANATTPAPTQKFLLKSSTSALDMLATQATDARPDCRNHDASPATTADRNPIHGKAEVPPPGVKRENVTPTAPISMTSIVQRQSSSPAPHRYNPYTPLLAGVNPAGVYSNAVTVSVSRRQKVEYLPPANPIQMFPTLFRNAPSTSKGCRCGSSMCLKLYCECFHNGVLCDKNLCRCKDCHNNEENNTRKGPREYAILKIIAKRPDAFHKKTQRRQGNWCKCRKNSCLKKYCECVARGRTCSSNCKCVDCKNQKMT